MRGVMRFERRGKISTRCIEPFKILRTIGVVTYELALPPTFSTIHPIFRVSVLRWYVLDESHMLQYEEVELDNHLTYIEEPVANVARDVRQLRSRVILVVKVYWRHHLVEEATWKTEQEMQEQFFGLFEPSGTLTFADKIGFFYSGYCNDLQIIFTLMPSFINFERSYSDLKSFMTCWHLLFDRLVVRLCFMLVPLF
ncbi:hypothetical protein MTR67_023429 [Solanum verrucosum]|uniref:Tf2-1-like SH3-like domain-containing protein n=1 Tax=Solanum verrucosum TaxID=315347 RepID=A0AAF0QTF8_SOLVR|nr:hypothetical protein MTR67_023429 [Solanum verrucosum]